MGLQQLRDVPEFPHAPSLRAAGYDEAALSNDIIRDILSTGFATDVGCHSLTINTFD
jgi:hypothetical protein